MVTGPQLRELALALPGTQERETWGHPTFRVGDKIFVGLSDDGTTANVKASREDQAELLAADPDTFRPAAHTGRFGWVTVRLDRVGHDELRELVTEAWRRTAPKRAVAAFDAQE